ncbi:MAG: DNA polymerase III subunit delta [Bdellovibrionota bacterium]
MFLLTPLNDKLKEKIATLEGLALLTLQSSNYQKISIIESIFSLLDDNASDIIKINSEEISLKKLEALSVNLFELSLFSPIRVFIINDIEKIKADLQKKLFEILENIPKHTLVILTAKSLNKTNIFYKHHLKNETLVDSTSIKEADIKNQIKEELKQINLTKYPVALIDAICEASKNNINNTNIVNTNIDNINIDNIKEIIEYLAIYVKEGTITLAEFEKLFPRVRSVSDFKILDPIYSSNYLEYMTLLKQILRNKNEFLLISIFYRTFSKLLEIKYFQMQKLTIKEITSKTGMQNWLIKKNLLVVSKYSTQKLKDCINHILKAEAKLKDRNLGTTSVFEELFFNLSA